tara:strand:- start:259 stop:582 length:324 start_codon:yes stop_codon:yes gene_type:complete
MTVATYPNRYCSDLKSGWCIRTKYKGPTDYRGPRIHATVQRDTNTLWEVALEPKSELESVDNHRRAAQLMIDTWDFKEYHPNMKIFAYGFDCSSGYYFLVNTPAEIA